MSDYELTITSHPAVADDPTQPGKKLTKDGQPVPLFPSQRAIRFNGKAVAYANADNGELKVAFFGIGGTLPESVKDEAVALAENEFKLKAEPCHVVSPIQPAPEED